MPTYDYKCDECGHTFEFFQSMTSEPLLHCPECNRDALRRLIGGGSGLMFKGTGFYLTDYKKSHSSGGGDGASKTTEAPAKPGEGTPAPSSPGKGNGSANGTSPNKPETT